MRMLVAGMLCLAALSARANEDSIELANGDGRDTVAANCVMCHSLDYIPMNSPFLDRKGWERTVNKMIKVMGAPIREDDVPVIVNYLTTHYGK